MDQLEQRLRAADPVTDSAPIEAPDSERARTLLEDIMQTDHNDYTDAPPVVKLGAPRLRGRRRWIAAAAAAAVAAVGVGVLATQTDDVDGGVPLALATAPDDPMAMCLEVTPESLLDQSEMAFQGTVVEVDGAAATLDVERWFTDGDAAQVVLTNTDADTGALLGGFELIEGESYLVAAADGNVLSCGLSGPAEPQLQGLFEAAFG